jgi:2-polyprenyl-3-methyl-5-hydroxy-6-metoxy-1,4-benzoquinol methylase
MQNHTVEIKSGERFEFGSNWASFLDQLNEDRILLAEDSLKNALGLDNLKGLKFLDAGSGSGLFSLAAKRMGATVVSFDYDPQSVGCTKLLKNKFFNNDESWMITEGSVLDIAFLKSLGTFDIIYSWGVLHHTGSMWEAINNCFSLINNDGKIFIAIYNDAGFLSSYWKKIKTIYCKYKILRPVLLAYAFLTMRSGWLIRGLMQGDLFKKFREYRLKSRGMSAWHDLVDWVGGYPYEYSKPEDIFNYAHKKGFILQFLTTKGGTLACNEFVFKAPK